MKRQSPRILVVDDEPDMCWVLENILRPAGYAVNTTMPGTEALELLAEEPYAVAFVDAKLPDLDGLELAGLIQQRSPQTAMVLISGYFFAEKTNPSTRHWRRISSSASWPSPLILRKSA